MCNKTREKSTTVKERLDTIEEKLDTLEHSTNILGHMAAFTLGALIAVHLVVPLLDKLFT